MLGLIGVFFAARQVVPFLLHQVIRLRNREMFFLLIVLLCLGAAWITYSLGLSLALGAFLAGLIISESEYSHHIVVEIMPFRDYFASIFFISIGMLLQTDYFMAHWSPSTPRPHARIARVRHHVANRMKPLTGPPPRSDAQEAKEVSAYFTARSFAMYAP